jgi:RimJ/RimL family protein N-acetyltransferase
MDDEMRDAMGGPSIAVNEKDCYDYYDYKYRGGNMLIGVESDVGRIAGCIFLEEIDTRNRRCYLHFAFRPGYFGVKKAASRVADYIFNDLHLRQTHGIIREDNNAAMRFVRKMGWKRICILPGYFERNGKPMIGYHYYLENSLREF